MDDMKKAARVVNLVVTVGLLVILAVGLGVIVVSSAQAVHHGDAPDRKAAFARVSAVAMALLAMVLVLLFWVVVRHVRARLHAGREKKPTPYVDAWAESGKRFKLDKEEYDTQSPQDPDAKS
jgi:hypothetical protein